jgi:hypothetical protein
MSNLDSSCDARSTARDGATVSIDFVEEARRMSTRTIVDALSVYPDDWTVGQVKSLMADADHHATCVCGDPIARHAGGPWRHTDAWRGPSAHKHEVTPVSDTW